jgi:predicted ABC-type ATPase
MKTCYVMVGLPGLGKSTHLSFLDDPEFGDTVFVYSTDAEIEKRCSVNGWTYNEGFSEFIQPATKYMNEMLEIAMRQGIDVYWDQTNLTVKKRRLIINRMKKAGYRVECISIVPPEPGHFDDLKAWKYRLLNRPGKTIPDHIMTSMYQNYTEPTLGEGFDRLRTYSMYGHLLDEETKE